MTKVAALLLALLMHDGAAFAQDAPKLPDSSPLIGPLMRGPNGEIEPETPATMRAAGRTLCDAQAKCTGPGETYRTLAAALAAATPGDTIDLVAATYREAAIVTVPHLTIRGVAGTPHIDCAKAPPGPGNACLAVAADGVRFDNLEVSGAAGACIASSGDYAVSLDGIFCHDSKAGFEAAAGTVSLVHSQFYDNAGGVTLGAQCTKVTVSGSIFRDAAEGDEFSSRCRDTEISDSEIHSMRGLRALDLPEGGAAMVYRTTLEKGEQSKGGEIVSFARESCAHSGTLSLKEVEIDNRRWDGKFVNSDKCAGVPVVLDHVTVMGSAILTQGFYSDLGGNRLNPAVPAGPQALSPQSAQPTPALEPGAIAGTPGAAPQ